MQLINPRQIHGSPEQDHDEPRMTQRTTGIALAGLTAVISGFSIFINGYGVRRFDDATTYTTAKNMVAATLVTALFLFWRHRNSGAMQRPKAAPETVLPRPQRIGVFALVAVIGGSLPFVLFFEGLSRATSTDAAFLHKTLVAWVAILAVVLLRERVGPLHLVAIGLILWGHALTMGGIGLPQFGTGELLILAATLCWSVEVVVSRHVLQRGVDELALGTARMFGGVLVLIVWALVRGEAQALVTLTANQVAWTLVTGVFLTAYVVSWHFALARAQAVDVTAILVIGAVITALLNAGIRDVPLRPAGLVLLGVGGLLIFVGASQTQTKLQLS